jgi:ribonuclease VapC
VIVVDTSAIFAIFLEEPEGPAILQCLTSDPDPRISAGTLLEASIVLRTMDRKVVVIGDQKLDEMVDGSMKVEPVTVEQVEIARAAYAQFGRGMGHPARLNFGDCFAYALAKSLNAPLLYKGNDFARTDIRSAL